MDDLNLTINPTWGSILKLIGEEDAHKMTTVLGGKYIYIPEKVGEHSVLASALGMEAASKLAKVWPCTYYDVPLTAGKVQSILDMKEKNIPVIVIAQKMNCSRRHVHRIIRAEQNKEDQENQLNLF